MRADSPLSARTSFADGAIDRNRMVIHAAKIINPPAAINNQPAIFISAGVLKINPDGVIAAKQKPIVQTGMPRISRNKIDNNVPRRFPNFFRECAGEGAQ
jgi:hypothetical protein